ncbi:hypothetical protein PHYBLDRAFT_166454 [Phycomyces blakesleeanus NRRL 1555(-)]|uniref:Uncharacterized protein n=1 Tax=Phycomyces blakesleeanus (strain ATCC 8743b / DSM 1359 / FGSC 10004 / NBRC 33097 / NRRL 1555) TaxID=763407 RepID=A0A167NQY7_PHYB8|nr:hypothetical protein PHYBLDRAFT_166454 [Phycomyces blakesleeanus NRRL 1555(-)]OAD76489.1 hypothetical protein PHYBLDRAFT_166454 [Phycomyces blakesleeanus NRRL 1555(-)]|eukprot:XP_018294529.1 hypothetical protein PHYBLDRAFT_166454 [Phycomyces blakesleeanus NRRL 1555(-)]
MESILPDATETGHQLQGLDSSGEGIRSENTLYKQGKVIYITLAVKVQLMKFSRYLVRTLLIMYTRLLTVFKESFEILLIVVSNTTKNFLKNYSLLSKSETYCIIRDTYTKTRNRIESLYREKKYQDQNIMSKIFKCLIPA